MLNHNFLKPAILQHFIEPQNSISIDTIFHFQEFNMSAGESQFWTKYAYNDKSWESGRQ